MLAVFALAKASRPDPRVPSSLALSRSAITSASHCHTITSASHCHTHFERSDGNAAFIIERLWSSLGVSRRLQTHSSCTLTTASAPRGPTQIFHSPVGTTRLPSREAAVKWLACTDNSTCRFWPGRTATRSKLISDCKGMPSCPAFGGEAKSYGGQERGGEERRRREEIGVERGQGGAWSEATVGGCFTVRVRGRLVCAVAS